MGCGLAAIFLTSAAILTGLVGYVLYVPMPGKVDNPAMSSLQQSQFKATFLLAYASSALGLGDFFPNLRRFQHWLITFGLSSSSNDEMDVQVGEIEGVRVRTFLPKIRARHTPALIYFHGGGWVTFSPEVYDPTTYEIAKQSQMVVISVDYRLAPENPFPGPLQDCLAVTVYILQHGANLGVDVERVGVGGDSAGGNLAAVVSQKLTDPKYKHLPRLRYQFLIYPSVQALDFSLPSFRNRELAVPAVEHCSGTTIFIAAYTGLNWPEQVAQEICANKHVSPETMSKYSYLVDRKLLPEKYQKAERDVSSDKGDYNASLAELLYPFITNPDFMPLMASKETLARSPATFIISAEFDVLRDDSLLYARHLMNARVKVVSHHLEKGYHSIMILSPFQFLRHKTALDAIQEFVFFVRETISL